MHLLNAYKVLFDEKLGEVKNFKTKFYDDSKKTCVLQTWKISTGSETVY